MGNKSFTNALYIVCKPLITTTFGLQVLKILWLVFVFLPFD